MNTYSKFKIARLERENRRLVEAGIRERSDHAQTRVERDEAVQQAEAVTFTARAASGHVVATGENSNAIVNAARNYMMAQRASYNAVVRRAVAAGGRGPEFAPDHVTVEPHGWNSRQWRW